jgi:hypothetical protein
MNQNKQNLIGISFDFDSIDSHLKGYNICDASPCNAHYRIALPRILKLLDKFNAKATFFLIAQELSLHPESAKLILESGHEIASHSLSHPVPFQNINPEQLHSEIFLSKQILEEISGQPVIGFRAPSWDANPFLLSKIAQAGYQYDASTFPSWLMFLYRWKIAKLSNSENSSILRQPIKQMFSSVKPHRLVFDKKALIEIPITTAPFIGVPYYHTMKFVLPSFLFNLTHQFVTTRTYPIHYVFHAADFLSIRDDSLDPRIDRHPGMRYCLADKLSIAENALNRLKSHGSLVSLKSISSFF